jgi:hypothetical protein
MPPRAIAAKSVDDPQRRRGKQNPESRAQRHSGEPRYPGGKRTRRLAGRGQNGHEQEEGHRRCCEVQPSLRRRKSSCEQGQAQYGYRCSETGIGGGKQPDAASRQQPVRRQGDEPGPEYRRCSCQKQHRQYTVVQPKCCSGADTSAFGVSDHQ